MSPKAVTPMWTYNLTIFDRCMQPRNAIQGWCEPNAEAARVFLFLDLMELRRSPRRFAKKAGIYR